MRTPRGIAASTVTLIAVIGLVAGACSSDEPASTVSAQQECAALEALKGSVTALTEVQPVQDGPAALRDAVNKVKEDLATANDAVSTAMAPAVDDVQSAFDQLESALQGVTTGNLATSATEIGTALVGVGTALDNLKTELVDRCPEA